MKYLKIPIKCGVTTCAREPGKFCEFARTQRFGQEVICQIFSGWGDKRRVPLDTVDGWTQRHPDCLKLEVSDE